MEPFCWKEVFTVLSLNYWNTKLVKEGLKRENWDPRRCVSTRALPILWVTGCQLAQTAVNQDGQRNQNHLRGKSYSSETPAKFEVPSVSQTFCLLLLQPHRHWQFLVKPMRSADISFVLLMNQSEFESQAENSACTKTGDFCNCRLLYGINFLAKHCRQ